MRVAIYQFTNLNGDCPSCNQATRKQLIIDAVRCKEKIHELFPEEEHEFKNYIDFNEVIEDGVKKRIHLDDLIKDIRAGEIDAVITTYLGAVDSDIYFVIELYKIMKECGVKLITVREGISIMKKLDTVMEG